MSNFPTFLLKLSFVSKWSLNLLGITGDCHLIFSCYLELCSVSNKILVHVDVSLTMSNFPTFLLKLFPSCSCSPRGIASDCNLIFSQNLELCSVSNKILVHVDVSLTMSNFPTFLLKLFPSCSCSLLGIASDCNLIFSQYLELCSVSTRFWSHVRISLPMSNFPAFLLKWGHEDTDQGYKMKDFFIDWVSWTSFIGEKLMNKASFILKKDQSLLQLFLLILK